MFRCVSVESHSHTKKESLYCQTCNVAQPYALLNEGVYPVHGLINLLTHVFINGDVTNESHINDKYI